MYAYKQPSRRIPGIISYMDIFSTAKLAYSTFFTFPLIISIISMILNGFITGVWNILYLFVIYSIFLTISGVGALLSIFYYSKKSPILLNPPKGWGLQLNAFYSAIIGLIFNVGQILSILLRNVLFQEIFFMLGTIIAYIIAYVIYFSFTTIGKYGNVFLALIQPVSGIILYSILTAQVSFIFFFKAIIIFCSCAFIFAIPYARSMARVSNIYRQFTGIGGYPFIRAFVLSMMTDDNDKYVESFFDKIGIETSIKVQYIAIRACDSKKLKGLFIIPHVHFGPFKTCGSSDLPARIYKMFEDIPGTTVYHTTNDHSQNLTTHNEVKKVLSALEQEINRIKNDSSIKWVKKIRNVTRKISNSAKLIGTEIENVPIVFLTRHPLPSDDIEENVGNEIRKNAINMGFKDVVIIDSHNSIIGDEVLIKSNSIEAIDLINVSNKFFNSLLEQGNKEKSSIRYGVARDKMEEFSERDGIGPGGLVVNLFENSKTKQKTAFIHFDGNNAFVDIRSYILNMLQNQGIERGEITTSDSHIVARRFNQRGYSPIGEKIKLENILEKLDRLIPTAENNLEDVEFYYGDFQVENVRIWGDPKYFDTIMNTLQECIRISQKLLTFGLIAPTILSLVILILFYNVKFSEIFNLL